MSWALEHAAQVEVIGVGLWPWWPLLAGSRTSPAAITPPRSSRLSTISRTVARLPEQVGHRVLNRIRTKLTPANGRTFLRMRVIDASAYGDRGIDLCDPAFLETCVAARRVWLCGWRVVGWPLLDAHAAKVRATLAPVDRFMEPARRLVTELRNGADRLVGVLVRQTDYRVYREGRFWLDTPAFRRRLLDVSDLFPGERLRFLLSSDTVQPAGAFEGLDVAWSPGTRGGNGHLLDTVAAFSMCDLVTGPPSTLAGWCAFLGAKPYLPLLPERPPERKDILANSIIEAAAHPIYGIPVS